MDQKAPQGTSPTPKKKVGFSPRRTLKSSLGFGEKCAYWFYLYVKRLSRKWFTHCFLSIVLFIYTIGGAFIFKTIEGRHENTVKGVDIREARYALIEEVTILSLEMPFENQTTQWMARATERMNTFFGLVIENHKIEDFIKANRDDKFPVHLLTGIAFVFGYDIIIIGYGHMYPGTTAGRALSIVYAFIGIPLFLIALTDFGKLFKRCIKFVWSFVRRLYYYTGSRRRARKAAAAGDVIKEEQMFSDLPTFRRPSKCSNAQSPTDSEKQAPTTPALSNFEIDDKFNLPISVALFILLSYILCGTVMYMMSENWDFFEAFYFVFISMSTIGFGDYVPRDPVFMIVSLIYLIFGLALMSMCINVVQAKLSGSFKEASSKINGTMVLHVDEDDGIIALPENMDNIVPIIVSNRNGASSEEK